MATTTRTLTLPKAVELLQTTTPPAPVLSAYLATTPNRVRGQGYVIAYRTACAGVRSSLPEEQHAAFDTAAARVEQYLTNTLAPVDPGLAVFAAADEHDYFFAVPLPEPPADQVQWGIRPRVEPLVATADEYERIAIVLFDKERARLFTVYLGEVEEQQAFEDYVPGKQATGGWFALAQTRYARHHEEHVRRHVERAVAELTRLLRKRPFDRLFLAGPDEAISMLRHQLTRTLRTRFSGTLELEMFASEPEILRVARAAAEEVERQEEVNAVNELVGAITSRHAALGLYDTTAAINDGRVHLLFVAEGFTAHGSECPTCERLVVGAGACPQCGTATVAADDYGEAIVRHALAQGARIEEVRGEAAVRLSEYDGVGAWTRY
jgi:Bacterial archaeo-eukaryotic release factor family 10